MACAVECIVLEKNQHSRLLSKLEELQKQLSDSQNENSKKNSSEDTKKQQEQNSQDKQNNSTFEHKSLLDLWPSDSDTSSLSDSDSDNKLDEIKGQRRTEKRKNMKKVHKKKKGNVVPGFPAFSQSHPGNSPPGSSPPDINPPGNRKHVGVKAKVKKTHVNNGVSSKLGFSVGTEKKRKKLPKDLKISEVASHWLKL